MNSEVVGLYVLGGVLLFIIGIMFLISLIFYVIQGVTFQRMAKKLELDNPWYAWIPVLNIYLMGKLAGDKVKIGGKCITNIAWVLLGVTFGYSFLNGIMSSIYTMIENEMLILVLSTIQVAIFVVYMVVYYIVVYKIFRVFDEKNATRNIVLSIVIGVLQPFLLLSVSNKEPNMKIYLENYEITD